MPLASRTARSVRYRRLEGELQRLRNHLLPARFSATGSYPERVFTRTYSYRLLVHAEIEAYLEDRVWDLALDHVRALSSKGLVTRTITCLLAFSNTHMEAPPQSFAPPKGTSAKDWQRKVDFSEKVASALTVLKTAISENHGIRERHLLRLLFPIGIGPNMLDPVWLATIDAFGEKRGQFAHSSAQTYRATNLLDPKSELLTVGTILTGLRELDHQINLLTP